MYTSLVTRTVAPRRLKNASITHSPYLRPTFAPKSESNRLSDTRTNKMRQKGDQFTNAPFDRHIFAFLLPGHPVGEQKTQHLFLFAIQVPGQPFYEWNPKLIHLRHAFVFCSFFVRIKSAMATERRMEHEQFSLSS